MRNRRILNERSSAGLDVTLWWDSQTDEVGVTVTDHNELHEPVFELRPNKADALKAFHHPFAYECQLTEATHA
jgi:hypothetical protein